MKKTIQASKSGNRQIKYPLLIKTLSFRNLQGSSPYHQEEYSSHLSQSMSALDMSKNTNKHAHLIGSIDDNIKKGYSISHSHYKFIFKSWFKFRNETTNVRSHLLGACLVICLLALTISSLSTRSTR
jgi:hypothetical protein